MTALEFQPWPKIARLNRNITITEKLDGTNAAIVIVEAQWGSAPGSEDPNFICSIDTFNEATQQYTEHHIYAQSRNRFITPSTDNYGFAGWVYRNAQALVELLGAGTHFGEWWGSGIQRGYGLRGEDKRFSLFNTGRWSGFFPARLEIPGLDVVPVLYDGPFDELAIKAALLDLRVIGSKASPGFDRPEGIVIWHEAARQSFKVTLEGDEAPKAAVRSEHDLLPEAVAA